MRLKRHMIGSQCTIFDALVKINDLGQDMILFVVENSGRLLGTLTDGDIRRALVDRKLLTDTVDGVMRREYRYLRAMNYRMEEITEIRRQGVSYVPVLDHNLCIERIVNLQRTRSFLPVEAVVMAGGAGMRLRPMTETVPKPLLKVGDKAILQHNLEHLVRFGVEKVAISIRYLGEQIKEAFGDGGALGCQISYLEEARPLGTIGALRRLKGSKYQSLIVMNSDLLTNIDFEDLYLDFERHEAAMSVATIPYRIKIPYAVLATEKNMIRQLKEKPEFVHYSNAGIYLIRSRCLELIPENQLFNATDLIELLISKGEKVISYPLRSYWLDIGKPEDFEKAQEDIQHIRF